MICRRTLRYILCPLLGLALSCRPAPVPTLPESAAPPSADASRVPLETLTAGSVLDLDLTAGEGWQAELTAASESFVLVVVEQRSLDVALALVGPDGARLTAVDGPGGIGTDERLAARLPAGSSLLTLSAKELGPTEGRVRLRIVSLRPWTTTDAERVRLSRLGQEAAQLDGSSSHTDWERSYELSLEELKGWRSLGDTTSVIRTLNRLGSLERALSHLEASIVHGREAVDLSLASGDTRAEAASRYWLAQSLVRSGSVAEGTAEYAQGLVAAERAADPRLQGRILNWQGRLSHRQGDLAKARDLLRRALAHRTEAHDMIGVAPILNNLGRIASDLGQFSLALDYYEKAINTARQLNNSGPELTATSNLSMLLATQGRWQEALEARLRGLEASRAADDIRNESLFSSNLANMLLRLGEPNQARPLLERSLEIEQHRGDAFVQVGVLLALARVDAAQGRLVEASERLSAAYELCQTDSLQRQETYVLGALAEVRLQQRRPRQALGLLERALAAPGLGLQPVRRARALRDLAETHLQLGDPEAALRHLGSAVDTLGALEVPEVRFDLAHQSARTRYALGDLMGAVEEIELALEFVESLRLAVEDPDLRATFLSRLREAYDLGVGLLLELHQQQPTAGFARRAFTTLERGRARSLVELLSRARSGAEQALDPQLLEAERTALAAFAQARQRMTEGVEQARIEELTELRTELERARALLSEAENRIKEATPHYASLRYGNRYTVEQIQRVLDPGTAIVEYSLRQDRSVAFIITRDNFEVVSLAGESLISQEAAALRRMLGDPNRRAYGQLQRHARELGALVAMPLLVALEESTKLVIIPDGVLSYVPLEVLRISENGPSSPDRYLIERFITSYAPSSGVLLTLADDRKRPSRGSGLAAFADPEPPTPGHTTLLAPGLSLPPWPRLPGARREVATVAATLSALGETATFVDRDASERNLKENRVVRGARWLHLAAHALIDEQVPANSAVVLASDPEGEDGYLTVQEVFGLELAAELVVLSGCDTALGKHVRGEGLIGLTRAFLYAGARGIQVSLWKVADKTTPELMSSFYGHLGQGMAAADALRQAKLASLNDPRRAHPFHWAPFVLIGS